VTFCRKEASSRLIAFGQNFQGTDKCATDLQQIDFSDPESKYFEYTLDGDGTVLVAKASVKVNLKDGQSNGLKGK
jgi:hypothetical protein